MHYFAVQGNEKGFTKCVILGQVQNGEKLCYISNISVWYGPY